MCLHEMYNILNGINKDYRWPVQAGVCHRMGLDTKFTKALLVVSFLDEVV